MILLLLLATTNWDLSPQNLEEGPTAGRRPALGLGQPLRHVHRTGRLPHSPIGTPTPRHSLLPIDFHIVLWAGAQGHTRLQQVEEFEEHLHVSVVGHLRRKVLLGLCCFFPSFLNPRTSCGGRRGWGSRAHSMAAVFLLSSPCGQHAIQSQRGRGPCLEELLDSEKTGKFSQHYQRKEKEMQV